MLVDEAPTAIVVEPRVVGMATRDMSVMSSSQRSRLEFELRSANVHFEVRGCELTFPAARLSDVDEIIGTLPESGETSSLSGGPPALGQHVASTLEASRAVDAAPLWRRYLAWTIDSVILVTALRLTAGMAHRPAIAFAAFALYNAIAIGVFGRTIGKAVLLVRVVRFRDGALPPIWSALVRALVAEAALILPVASAIRAAVGGAFLVASMVLMLTDYFRRGLADRVAQTRVILARR
jgi:RDD family